MSRARTPRCSSACTGGASARSTCMGGPTITDGGGPRSLSPDGRSRGRHHGAGQARGLSDVTTTLDSDGAGSAGEPRLRRQTRHRGQRSRRWVSKARPFRSATIAPRSPTATATRCSRSRVSSTPSSAAEPWFAGYCGVMVNLSDVAAMGGRPVAVVDALWAEDDASAAPRVPRTEGGGSALRRAGRRRAHQHAG